MTFGKKTSNPGWQSGNHWVTCDVCGLVYRNSDMRERWDGVVVCKYDYEPRHPQDLIKAVPDNTTPKGFIRVEAPDTFKSVVYFCSTTAQAGVAEAGCAESGESAYTELEEFTVPSGTFDQGL